MPVKTKVTKKKAVKKTSSIATYVRKVQNSPTVKKVSKTILDLEKKLVAAKKKKAAAVKIVRKKLKK
jgi:hypothetical protein